MRFEVNGENYWVKPCIILTIIVDIVLFVIGRKSGNFTKSLCIASFLTLMTIFFVLFSKSCKLIIDGDTLCYKEITKKYYSIKDIKKIHIAQAQIPINRNTVHTINDTYVMIYLKENINGTNGLEGNIEILRRYPKQILFTTVYDEQAIAYFRTKGIPVTGQKR